MIWDQVGFVTKVVGVAWAIALAFKTIAPNLSIPNTSAVSLAIVLLPAVIVGAILAGQLWIANHADSPPAGSD
ncbi:MAG: hypothetical protein AAF609_19510 [Cyanobacteria bacterium P01_C01_bin.120]